MKVIKQGKLIEQSWKEHCYKCNSDLEYVSSDIHHDFRDGNYIICPICKKFIFVSTYTEYTDRSKDC